MAVITKTIRVSGGDYANFTAWQNAEANDLVSAGDSHVLQVYDGDYGGTNGALDEAVLINSGPGWVTGPSNTLTIECLPGNGHDGVIDGGFILGGVGAGVQLNISLAHVTVRNMQVRNEYAAFNQNGVACGDFEGIVFDGVISEGTEHAASNGFGNGAGVGNTPEFRNCIAYNRSATKQSYGFDNSQGTATGKFINCQVIGSFATGFRNRNGVTMENCLSFEADADFSNDTTTNCSNNASGDATAGSQTAGQTGVTTADFENYAGGDYTPKAAGKLDGTGKDTSAQVTTDIKGVTRTLPYDIGAFAIDDGGVPAGSVDSNAFTITISAGGPPPTGKLFFGPTEIQDVRLGSTQIAEVYHGSNKLWP